MHSQSKKVSQLLKRSTRFWSSGTFHYEPITFGEERNRNQYQEKMDLSNISQFLQQHQLVPNYHFRVWCNNTTRYFMKFHKPVFVCVNVRNTSMAIKRCSNCMIVQHAQLTKMMIPMCGNWVYLPTVPSIVFVVAIMAVSPN